ncbi:hypothetical protein FB567DRAFT_514057 [Paraphoma chrysanthemicola]|uniref:Rhodopsin domain-containing protein n=1 Tax=Paraphoma chrysanthemicola TaxID=798071 RepID=A0A8K0W4T9_9PLEO|nr:hypothetical protein FB567DRAFT_514057 [Paraphoma chrysanthemicola]
MFTSPLSILLARQSDPLITQYDPKVSPVSPGRVGKTALIASLWAGVGVSFVFLILRTWIRIKVFRRLQADDPFVVLAFLLSVANAAIWTYIADDLYFNLALSNGLIPVQSIPANFLDRITRLIRGNLAAYLLGYFGLWSVKISFIVFFRRFGEKLRAQRIAWYVVLGFCLASLAVCIGTVDYRCLTSSGMKIIETCQEPRTVNFEFITLRLTTALDVLTDFSIILLSTNVLWRIRLQMLTKLALGGIFSLTLFVIAVAIIRVVIAPRNGVLDLSWLVCWQGVEISVALIVVCLASFRILYTSMQNTSRAMLVQPHSDDSRQNKNSGSSSERDWTELSKTPSDSASYTYSSSNSRLSGQETGHFSQGRTV